MRMGVPLDEASEVGRLIRPAEVNRVHDWVTKAVDGGVRCLTGGHAVFGTCYAPTVLLDPPNEAHASQQEIFGLVVCVYSYTDTETAIRRANDLRSAFQAAVFTQNFDFALGAATRLSASAVMINDHTAFRVDWMPFAGLIGSGPGVGGIPHTFPDMRIDKLIVMHSPQL